MSATLIQDLNEQINKYWAPVWKQELLETTLMGALVNKEYEGEIKQGGDTVYVTQVTRPQGQRKTKGSGHEYFATEKMSTSRIGIEANQVISAAYEFDSLLNVQTDLEKNDSVIKGNLMQAMQIQLNNYLYSFVNAASPTSGVTDFNASQLSALRKFAGQKKWNMSKQWYCLADPSYHADLLNAQTLTSGDFVSDKPVVSGQVGTKRFNFNIFEDNSQGLVDAIGTAGGSATEDIAVAFHPDFLHMVTQMMPEFEIASLTSNKQFGYILVGKMLVGAKEGHDHADLHQVVINA